MVAAQIDHFSLPDSLITQLARWPPAKNGSNRNVRAMELFSEILMTNSDLVVSSSLLSLKACTRAVAVAWMIHTEIQIYEKQGSSSWVYQLTCFQEQVG